MPTVVLMTTFQHAKPGFLEEVLRQFTISREIYQVTQQLVLILLDETVQRLRIASTKTASNCSGLGFHVDHEEICCGVHAAGYTG